MTTYLLAKHKEDPDAHWQIFSTRSEPDLTRYGVHPWRGEDLDKAMAIAEKLNAGLAQKRSEAGNDRQLRMAKRQGKAAYQ